MKFTSRDLLDLLHKAKYEPIRHKKKALSHEVIAVRCNNPFWLISALIIESDDDACYLIDVIEDTKFSRTKKGAIVYWPYAWPSDGE